MIRNLPTFGRQKMAMDAYVFLMKELEKCDETIYEPLTGTDWPRDLPVVTGGGFVESVSSLDINYGSSGKEEDNLIFDHTTDIPIIQADMSKGIARTFTFAESISIGMIEKEKMLSIGRDPEAFLNRGIHLHCDKYLDKNAYTGFTKVNSTGLVNHARVVRISAPNGAAGTATWATKTADEILADVNTIIAQTWQANECSSDALPNHILIPVEQFGLIVTRKVSHDSERSILTYILENNLTRQQGRELVIVPCKWCKGAGSGGTDRMVAYMNQQDRVCFNLTQPLTRMENEFHDLHFKIPYVCQFSEVRLLYPSTARYMDGI